MPLSERRDALSWLTLPKSQAFSWAVNTALSMTSWITEKFVHTGCQRTTSKADHMGLTAMHLTHYADQGEQFLQSIVTWDGTWVNYVKPE
jgi:hypothetical protein